MFIYCEPASALSLSYACCVFHRHTFIHFFVRESVVPKVDVVINVHCQTGWNILSEK